MTRSDPSRRPRQTDDGDDLVDSLVQSSFTTMAVLNKVSAEHGLSLTQLRVLGILWDRRVRMAALADHLGLERSTMTGLIDRAEERGLVERAPNEIDGRAVDVFLTRAGRALAKKVGTDVRRALVPMTEHNLDATERRRLQGLLDRMLAGS